MVLQFDSRTILHGLAFLCVQLFPIVMGISIFYTQSNACVEAPEECFFPTSLPQYPVAALLLAFLILFAIFYSLGLYVLWARRYIRQFLFVHCTACLKHGYTNFLSWKLVESNFNFSTFIGK